MPFSFDAQPCSESKIDDLALGQFDAYRREAVDAKPLPPTTAR
jgi:ATP-dependent DNA helicase RecG